jgi:hypothetical protein
MVLIVEKVRQKLELQAAVDFYDAEQELPGPCHGNGVSASGG